MVKVSRHHPNLRPLTDDIFVGGGDMGARMRALDWSSTPLGPLREWPQSLRTAIGIVLGTRHPMLLLWGPELVQFYNDAFGQSLGPDRHGSALGQRARECWAEIWDSLEPQFERIMRHGEATWHEDHLVPITRGSTVEDVYWSYSYSPVWAEDRLVGGILVTVQETTKRVLAERRTQVLRELAARSPRFRSERHVLNSALEVLRHVPRDLPFVGLYIRDGESNALRLVGHAGADELPWPASPSPEEPAGRVLSSALESVEPVLLRDLTVVPGAWPLAPAADGTPPPTAALLVPIPRGESSVGAEGVLVAGLGSRLPLDLEYRNFLSAAAGQIGLNVAAVRADEASRLHAEALSEEAARLAELLELAPGFVAVLRGPDHVFDVVTQGYRALVGDRDLIGRPLRDALPELHDQGYLEILDQVLASGQPYRTTAAGVKLRSTPHGPLVQRYVDLVCQRMEASGNLPAGIFVYGMDATQRHEAASALTQSERRYRLLVESIPQVVWIADREGRLEYLSPWASSDENALLPRVEERFVERAERPEDAARAIAAWRHAIARETSLEFEARAKRPDGAIRWVLVRASPFRDETGVLRWFGTVTDIDTLKRAEEELREAHRMQAVKSLAGGVAHEINNHMTAVLGFGHFVLRALGADHEQAPDLRVVLQSADRAARVSQHLLAFTRQQVTQRSEVDLAAIVLDLEPLLAQILGPEKHLAIRSLGPATAPSVLADPDHVKQVLVDLVANARDATETGAQVEITMSEVRLERDLPAPLGEMVPAGRYVRLGVSDTGSGIPPEVLPRIFDPFFTTKSVGAGSGLGLSMVHGTLRRHGGYVRAESMPGVGTTIHLFWPLADHEATVVPADRPEGSRSTRSSGDLTVMVVEDEPHVRGLAVRALREVGFRVEDAADGRAALDRLEHTVTPPDVLVADLLMPRVNGRQLVDAVRERWPAMPVLFISGDAGATDADRRLIPSDVPLLRKPFTPEDFVEAVGKLAKVAAFASSEEAP